VIFYFQSIQTIVEKLLLSTNLESAVNITVDDLKDFPSYNLTTRLSGKKLINDYIQTMEKAQAEYLQKAQKAKEKLATNVITASHYDTILKDSTGYEDSPPQELTTGNSSIVLKGGTRKKPCIISDCDSVIFKMSRHLTSVHSDLTPEQIRAALEFSKLIENVKAENKAPITTAKNTTKRITTEKKTDYKQCSECLQIFLNLPDHIKKNHHLNKEDSKYKEISSHSKEIDRKLITYNEAGRAVMLEGAALEKAMADNNKEQSTETTSDLRVLKKRATDLMEKLQTAKLEEEDELNERLQIAKEEYRKQRYPDRRAYSSTSNVWKTEFTKSLERKK